MSVHYFNEPDLGHADMVCGWPGIGQVAMTVLDTLRDGLGAQPFAEVDPEPFFDPRQVTVHKGLLEAMTFPSGRFFWAQTGARALILFIGEAQPREYEGLPGDGRAGYRLAHTVLDVAERFGCRRIYTAGAAVTQIHHTLESRVWAVPNDPSLSEQLQKQENVVQMVRHGGDKKMGFISGLNGLLIGVAIQRGLPAACLMGELPYYVQNVPRPYPAAARAVLGVLTRLLGVTLDLARLDPHIKRTEREIDEILAALFADEQLGEFKRQIEDLKRLRQTEMGPITDEEQRTMLQHIDDLFKADDGSHRKLI